MATTTMAKRTTAAATTTEAPSETARTMAPLLRAAVADYRRRIAEDFTRNRGGLAPLDANGEAKWHALSAVESVLHRLVIAAHGGGKDSCAAGTMAVMVDGALVLIDEEDGLDEGERVHVIERHEVITFD